MADAGRTPSPEPVCAKPGCGLPWDDCAHVAGRGTTFPQDVPQHPGTCEDCGQGVVLMWCHRYDYDGTPHKDTCSVTAPARVPS